MSESIEQTCNACQKPQSQLSIPLKRCAKCRTAQYCSRECQKADWKNHKPFCSTIAGDNTQRNPRPNAAETSKGPCHIPQPFTAIQNGTWLHGRPEKDVYKLLVDVYRLRVEDEYKFKGEVEEGSLYSGASPEEALDCFRRFLSNVTRLDARRPKKLLPLWWSQTKLKECLDFATTDEFSNVGYAVEKPDIQEHYKENLMPMQLRMFGEKIDGTMTAGMSGATMLRMQVAAESGEGPAVMSHLSLA